MPKMKTKKSAAKRFKFTGSGKLKRKCMNHRHNLSNAKKSKSRKRRLGQTALVADVDHRRIARLLGRG